MKKPPQKIDNAEVLEWAWSGNLPFGELNCSDSNDGSINIYGFAICQYDGSRTIYRFSCNQDWECEQDSVYETVEKAKLNIPKQYKDQKINWIKNRTKGSTE